MTAPSVVPAGHATWIEIRRDALVENFRNVATHAGVPVCAVVKANGYGHGLVPAARIFAEAGAASLGVSRLDEARTLREAGIDAPILVLEPGADPAIATALRVSFALDDPSLVAHLPEGARVHLKIDTGMGRFGVRPEAALDAARALAARGALEGVMTHFANAGETKPGRGIVSARDQLARFDGAVRAIRDAGLDVVAHAAASGALLAVPDARLDLVRVGTLLYGQDPPGARAPWSHAETWSWFARVASVRTAAAGTSIGYGSEVRLRKERPVATLPVGWADGVAVDVAARTPTPRETLARLARTMRAMRRDPRTPPTLVADAQGTPVPERPLRILGRIAMQATTVEAGADVGPGFVCRIHARRLTVAGSIPRIVV